MLLATLGPASLVGISLLFANLTSNMLLRPRLVKRVGSRLAASDQRAQVMREIIDGAKVIKLQQWEEPFLALLDGKRELELRELRAFRLLQ
eukprot:2464468-Prymnesium_polylepis.1